LVKFHIGTAGWDYKDWKGSFYPKSLEDHQRLKFYTNFFEIVEINSTFYNLPGYETVEKWIERVPDDFRYVVKVWQKITHNLDDPEWDSYIHDFFNQLAALKDKIELFLLQFPRWFKYSEKHLKQLTRLINEIPAEYTNVIELRDNSWFYVNLLSKFIDGKRTLLGTTYMPNVVPFYFPQQNKYYIRLIGDREITAFNRIQREQPEAMSDLESKVNLLQNDPNIMEIFIIVNNHFQGSGPESANLVKKLFNQEVLQFTNQKRLTDFF